MQTVLAIDDEPLVLNSWKRILEALGARVVEARSGTEALLRLRGQSSFDLVLVDNALPDVRGLDLILRAPRGLRAKMVLVTAFLDAPLGLEAQRAGVLVLQKPVDRGVLATLLAARPSHGAPRQAAEFCTRVGLRSKRQHEILEGILNGMSRKEIAQTLGCSERTVDTHMRRIFDKTGIRSTQGLIVAVFRTNGARDGT